MIRLLKPYNHLGGLVLPGTIISLGDKEAALVESGAAEYIVQSKPVSTSLKKEQEKPAKPTEKEKEKAQQELDGKEPVIEQAQKPGKKGGR